MKKRSLKSMIDNPESITDDEKEDLKNIASAFFKLSKSVEPYNLKITTNNSNNNLAKRFYQEYFIMSAILEAFSFSNEINFKDLNETILNYVPKKFIWEIPVTELNKIIGKMIRFRFLEPIKTDDEYNPKFKITKKGIETFQQQTYQSLASSSFFNYQTFQLNKRANKMNVLMLIVTIMSVLVTIITIFG